MKTLKHVKIGHIFQPLESFNFAFLCINKFSENNIKFIRYICIYSATLDKKHTFKHPTALDSYDNSTMIKMFNDSLKEVREHGRNILVAMDVLIITNANIE